MNDGPSAYKIVVVCAISLLALVLFLGVPWLNHHQRQADINDFRLDVTASQLNLLPGDNPRLRTVVTGDRSAVYLEARVTVGRCTVVLRRNQGERTAVVTRSNRGIQAYKVVAVVATDGSDVAVVSDAVSPNTVGVRTILTADARFAYC